MRVLHLSTFFDPHLGYEEFYTAKYMAKKGLDVTVLTTKVSNDNKIKYNEKYETHESGFKIIRLPCIFRYGSDFVFMKGFMKTFRQQKPDLVYMHGSRLPQYAKIAHLKKDDSFLLFVDHHDFFFPGHAMQPMSKNLRSVFAKLEYHYFRRLISRYILKNADKVFSVTEVCRDHLVQYLKVSDDKIVPMEFAVDTEMFYYDEKMRNKVRQNYNVSPTDFLLNMTGIITRRKKFQKIVELMTLLQRQNLKKPIKLIIVGYFRDHNYEKEIMNLIRKHNISEHIIFTGAVAKEQIKGFYSAADAAFWLENNSITILEAMACGCVVLVPDMQLGHLVDGNGYTFEPGNIRQLSEAIINIINLDWQTFYKKKVRSMDLVKAKHNYETYVDKILYEYEIYRKNPPINKGTV